MSNIIFKQISMSNFMSFGREPNVVRLDEGFNWLITGENNDVGDSGESGNGAGKTTIMQAIIFALYGTGVDKMNADEFINLQNGKLLLVELDFSVGGEDYKIIRGRKPNIVEFYRGKGDIEEMESLTRDSMRNTDADIEKVLGITIDVFTHTIFMSPHIEPFMGMTPAKQRNMMESILKLDVLVDRADTLKDVIRKEVQDSLKLLKRDQERGAYNNEKVNKQISELKEKESSFNEDNTKELEALKRRLIELQVPADAKSNLDEYNDAVVQFEGDVANLDSKLQEEQANLSLVQRNLTNLKKSRLSLIDAQKKKVEFDVKQEEQLINQKERLASLPKTSDLNMYLGLIEECNEETSKKSKIQTEIKENLKIFDSKERELNSVVEHAESLAEGKCPTCEQEHFDEAKLESLTKQAEEIADTLDDIEEVNQRLEIDIANIDKQLEKNTTQIQEIEASSPLLKNYTTRRELDSERSSLEQQLNSSTNQNPYDILICDIEIEYGGLSDIEKNIESLEEQVIQLEEIISAIKSDREKIDSKKKAMYESLEVKSISELEMKESMYARTLEEISNTEGKINPYVDMIAMQKDLFVDIEEIDKQVLETEKELTHINYLIKLLTDPKSFVRKNIVDMYIPYVNRKIVEYTEHLGLAHIATINSNMTVDIEYMGKKTGYFTMSRGERLRLNTSTSLAFRDLINTLGQSCNLLMIDELLDGSADTSGMHRTFNLISRYVDDVFIISHRDEFKDQVDRNMKVIKNNGFTDIVVS